MTPEALAAAVKAAAHELGFEACGVTDLAPSAAAGALDRWLASGHQGDMAYLERQAPVRRELLRP